MANLKRLLFYVEPVIFREDPYFLMPWLHWLTRLTASQAVIEELEVGFMSNPWLCRTFQAMTGCNNVFEINPVDVLRPFHMDRILYCRDLSESAEHLPVNAPLMCTLERMSSTFSPDLILSFTQNRYLQAPLLSVQTVFSEMQPLPRTFGTGLFLDPSGHQRDSLLVRASARIRSIELNPEREHLFADFWSSRFAEPLANAPDTPAMMEWMRNAAEGAPIAMLALQPPDWLTVEGLSNHTSADGALMAWLNALPREWKAIATYHPTHKLSRSMELAIAEQMPNLILLPEEWSQGRSEWLMQAVDAVVTISSAVGWSALLSGKKVVSTGWSNLSGFSSSDIRDLTDVKALDAKDRSRLGVFLSSRYCVPMDDFLDIPGYAFNILAKLLDSNEGYYFDDI